MGAPRATDLVHLLQGAIAAADAAPRSRHAELSAGTAHTAGTARRGAPQRRPSRGPRGAAPRGSAQQRRVGGRGAHARGLRLRTTRAAGRLPAADGCYPGRTASSPERALRATARRRKRSARPHRRHTGDTGDNHEPRARSPPAAPLPRPARRRTRGRPLPPPHGAASHAEPLAHAAPKQRTAAPQTPRHRRLLTRPSRAAAARICPCRAEVPR